jgi:hypothetical protein
MRTSLLPVLCLIALSACRSWTPLDGEDGGAGCPVQDAGLPPDMTTPPPKCAAAKGLQGDNLLCVDFKDVQMLSSLAGWNFNCMQVADSWISSGGKLQVNSFSTFKSTCTFTMPALSSADYQKYSGFALSLVQQVSLDESAAQKVQVMQGADDPLNRLLTQWTGKQARQQSVTTVSKSDLPGGAFQPLLKLSATNTAGGIYQGWQIESIAINGVLP